MSTLQELFPGTAVVLSNGKTVVILPWSAWKLAHVVPAKVGSLLSVLIPAFREGGSEDVQARVLAAVIASAGTLADFLCEEAGLTMEDLRGLLAADLVKIAQAVVEQNMSFFGALVSLRAVLSKQIPTAPTG